MGKYLDVLVEQVAASRREALIQDETGESADLLYETVKKSITDAIVKEVKDEVKAEALEEARLELEAISIRTKLKDYTELAISGAVVAVLIGLLVNQVTELIGYFKGSISSGSVVITFIFVVVFFVLAVGVFVILFGREVLRLIKKK